MRPSSSQEKENGTAVAPVVVDTSDGLAANANPPLAGEGDALGLSASEEEENNGGDVEDDDIKRDVVVAPAEPPKEKTGDDGAVAAAVVVVAGGVSVGRLVADGGDRAAPNGGPTRGGAMFRRTRTTSGSGFRLAQHRGSKDMAEEGEGGGRWP